MLIAGACPTRQYASGASSSEPDHSSDDERTHASQLEREVNSLERELEQIIEQPTRKRKRASDSAFVDSLVYDASQPSSPSLHPSQLGCPSVDAMLDPLSTRIPYSSSTHLSSDPQSFNDISDILAHLTEQLDSSVPSTSNPMDQSEDSAPKSFACEECTRGFARRSDLLRHRRIHTGEKPHHCKHPGCSKAFIQRSALTVHQRTHTGERPHICEHPDCHKAFGDSSSLARHRRTHTGRRPFECPEDHCDKTFTRKATLLHHMKSHGPEWDIPVPSIFSFNQQPETTNADRSARSTGNTLDTGQSGASSLPIAAPPMATYLSHSKEPRKASHTKSSDSVNAEDISASVAAAIAQATAQAALEDQGGSGESSDDEIDSNLEDGPTIVAGTDLEHRVGEQSPELDAWVNEGMVDDETSAG